MSTIPSLPRFNNLDLARLWAMYHDYKNALHTDSSALDDGHFESILETVKDLLRLVEYQNEMITAQSRKVSVKAIYHGEAKH